MKNLLLTTALILAATPAFAKDFTIKEVTDDNAKKQNFFLPDNLTIQPGDTVIFEDAQDGPHDVMFNVVPKTVDEMIMSPTMEKKGENFSYTFTVPGTYKFHCHPHEALGMTGTLIVGTPSKPGETKKVSHHDMGIKAAGDHHDAAAAAMPQGTGKIISVDADKHTVKLKHDPIKSLGWPVMTMTFTADSGVDLSSFKEGDAVAFALKPVGKDDYTLTSLKKQ